MITAVTYHQRQRDAIPNIIFLLAEVEEGNLTNGVAARERFVSNKRTDGLRVHDAVDGGWFIQICFAFVFDEGLAFTCCFELGSVGVIVDAEEIHETSSATAKFMRDSGFEDVGWGAIHSAFKTNH